MPLPIAHSAAGLTGYFAFKKRKHNSISKQELYLLALCLLLANLPDLDFVAGLLYGELGKFHHGPSHSFLVCVIIAILVFYFVRYKFTRISNRRVLASCLLSLLSHPVLDYFSKDTSAPFGVPLFWPFDSNYYISSISLFNDVHRSEKTLVDFLVSLINSNNIWSVVLESLFSGTIIFCIYGLIKQSKRVIALTCFALSFMCGFVYFVMHIKPQ